MTIYFAKAWFGDMQKYFTPLNGRSIFNYCSDLFDLAANHPADKVLFYYHTRLFPSRNRHNCHQLVHKIESGYDNIAVIDLADMATRKAKSRFSENSLEIIDMLAATSVVNYGYLWDMVRLAHLEAFPNAVPMDVDASIIQPLSDKQLMAICARNEQKISFALNQPNMQNAVMFSVTSQNAYVTRSILKINQFFKDSGLEKLSASISAELVFLEINKCSKSLLKHFAADIEKLSNLFPQSDPAFAKLLIFSSQLRDIPEVGKPDMDKAYNLIRELGDSFGFFISDKDSWLHFFRYKTFFSACNPYLDTEVVEDVVSFAAANMASMVLKWESGVWEISPREAASIFLIAFRINNVIFSKTCLTLLHEMAHGNDSVDRDAEFVLVFYYLFKKMSNPANYLDTVAPYLTMFSKKSSNAKNQYFLTPHDYVNKIRIESHSTWQDSV